MIFLLLQTPFVKEFLAQKVVTEISGRTDHRIELGQIHISWLDQVVASDVHLYDLTDSTMLKAEQVEVNFDLFGLFNGQTLFFDDIVVQGAALNLVRYPGATSINLKTFLDRLSGKKATQKKKTESQEIRIGNVELLSTRFVNRNLNVPPREDSLFDFNDLTLEIQEMIVNDLSLKGSVLNASVLSLKADHATTDLQVEDLKTELYLDDKHLTLSKLDLRTPASHIGDSVALSFNHYGNLSQFSDSVQLDLDLEASTLSLLDLRHFARLPSMDTTLMISAKASGVLSRLSLEAFEVGVSSGTMLAGSGIIFGLPDANETFADLQISNGILNKDDLPNLLGDFDYGGGGITFAGDFVGFFKDFVAAAEFKTAYGTINSDINVKVPGSVKDARYTGGLQLDGFDLGRVVGEDQLGSVSLVAEVQGSGITKENIDLDMDVKFSELVYNDYAYDSLIAKGQFKDRFFDGTFQVFDPHCWVGGRADIALAGPAKLDLDIEFDTLHLQELNFVSERLDIGGAIVGEIEDLSIDEAGGQLRLQNLEIANERGRERLSFLNVEASAIEGKKIYAVSTPDFLAKLEGSFLPSALLEDLPAIIESYYLLLTTDREDLQLSDESINHDTTTRYSWQLDLELMDVNPYLELLGLPLHVSEDAVVQAEFSRRKNINLSFFAEADSLQLGPDSFATNTLEVSASRDLASTDVLALIQMSSARQTWDRTDPSADLFLEWVWFNNTIDSQLKIDQPSLKNRLVLNNQVRYLKDSIIFKIMPSDIVVDGNTWRFDRDNYISWVNDYMTLHDLEVVSGDQLLYLAGQYAFDSLSSLAFGVENFDLFNLNPFFRKKVEGRMSLQGEFGRIGREDLRLDGKLAISDLMIEGLQAGDLFGETSFDAEQEKIFLDLNLTREGVKTIDLTGYLYPYEEYDQVSMDIDFDQANIALIQPFLEETFSDISGSVSGEVNVGGQMTAPTFFGDGVINDGNLRLNFTNTSYKIEGPLSFDSYEVAFRGLNIKDDVNGKGKLFGSIYHDNLTNVQVDFLLSFEGMRLLNTSAKDNDLYYGRIFGTGDLRVSGATSNLALGGEVTTVGNTRVFFPLESTGNAYQEDYILFIDPRAQEGEVSSTPFRDAGVTIDLDLNVTPDAYAELIFDAQKGDIIRGRTQGALQVQLNKSGELSVNGGLEIISGAYNFTVPGINKEFQLRRGGTISWT
ncbi:MAG: translocation/assembly module TamB domain-containing protein, partial [Bacteroidota bacterium]